MKLKFETIFRSYIFILVIFLLWSGWSSAQEATNVTARPEARDTGGSIIRIPSVIQPPRTLLTFGLDRVEALQPELFGNPRWQYLAALIYIVLAFYAAKLVDYITRVWLRKWAAKSQSKFDDLLIDLLDGPMKLVVFLIFLHIGLSVFRWPPLVERNLDKALSLIVVGVITFVALKSVDLSLGYWRIRTAGEDKAFNEQLVPLLSKSIKVFVLVVAFLYVCENVFQKDIKALIASLSIGGLAIGLAAQDTLANLFGAVAVFVDKPFRIGDFIKLPDIEGVVEAIGLRSTRVRNLDGHLITVPNKMMGNTAITNVARRTSIRTVTNFGLTYDMSAAKMREALAILDDVFNKHPMTRETIISFNRFADSALNIQVVHFWNGTDAKAQLADLQELNLAVKERFEAAKINFAFPTQTLYLKQDSNWRLEPVAHDQKSSSQAGSQS